MTKEVAQHQVPALIGINRELATVHLHDSWARRPIRASGRGRRRHGWRSYGGQDGGPENDGEQSSDRHESSFDVTR
jgi:hypothetical protein